MSIRTNFKIALDKYNDFINEDAINEGNIGYYQTMGQSSKIEDKQKMFDAINKDYFKGKSPFSKRLILTEITDKTMQQVYTVLNENMPKANILFNLKRTGIGSGEIMMAYIVENLTIGGGSADVDLNLFDSKTGKLISEDKGGVAELKEVTLTTDGFLTDWRTGAKHAAIRAQAIADVRALYLEVRDKIPELDPTTTSGKLAEKSAAKGEFSAMQKYFKDILEIPGNVDKDFKLSPGLDNEIIIKYQGTTIGNIQDKKTIDSITNILSQGGDSTVKTWNQIEEEVATGFAAIKESFVFIRTTGKSGAKKIQTFYYKENLPGTTDKLKIAQVTQNTKKVKVTV